MSEVNKPDCSKELLKREQVNGSPFWIIGSDETGYFLAMGNHRLTEMFPTKADTLEALKNDKWNIIANLIAIMVPKLQNDINENN